MQVHIPATETELPADEHNCSVCHEHEHTHTRLHLRLFSALHRFLGPDKHSFPSGHTSRCFTILLLVLLFRSNGRVSSGLCWATGVWAAAVSLSRVLLGRHYLGDLAGGFVLAHINMLLYSRFASGATRLEDLSPWSSTFFLR